MGHSLRLRVSSSYKFELDVCLLGTCPQLEWDAIRWSMVLGYDILIQTSWVFLNMAICVKKTHFPCNHMSPIRIGLFINIVRHKHYCTFLIGYRIRTRVKKNQKPIYTYSNTWAPYWNANGMRTRVFSSYYFAAGSHSL